MVSENKATNNPANNVVKMGGKGKYMLNKAEAYAPKPKKEACPKLNNPTRYKRLQLNAKIAKTRPIKKMNVRYPRSKPGKKRTKINIK